MPESPEFIGKKYSDEELSGKQDSIRSWSQESSEPLEGELEKNEEEVRMIETINILIEEELHSLGVEMYEPISPEKIHILSNEVFEKHFPDVSSRAFFQSRTGAIYVNKDKAASSTVRQFSNLLHELIHRASTKKFYADEEGGIYDARVGYRLNSPWKKEETEQDKLRGFNELMNDYTVYKILSKNEERLRKELGITKDDIEGPIYTYTHYGPVLEAIIKKVAADKQVPQAEVFDRLERGQFENSLLVLKDVGHAFGRDSLKVLACLGTLNTGKERDDLDEMIRKYFEEPDDGVRERMGIQILDTFKKIKEA